MMDFKLGCVVGGAFTAWAIYTVWSTLPAFQKGRITVVASLFDDGTASIKAVDKFGKAFPDPAQPTMIALVLDKARQVPTEHLQHYEIDLDSDTVKVNGKAVEPDAKEDDLAIIGTPAFPHPNLPTEAETVAKGGRQLSLT
jgi:hypothetical protein